MKLHLTSAAFLMLLCAASQMRAQDKVRTDLLDPVVQKKFDGLIRPGAVAGTTEAYIPVLFPSSHAANLLELKNGDLLCVWFSGTWEGDSDVAPVFSRLKKGSKEWSKPRVIDHRPGESFQNPVIFESPDGVLHVYHTTQKAKAGEAEAKVLESDSSDGGVTWGAPRVLFAKNGAFTRHPLVILADGQWLLPMTYVTSKGIGKGSETNYSVMEMSSDQGKSWKECSIEGSFGKVQPTVVPIAPHRLIAFFRSRAADWIYQSRSEDGCRWTPPVKTVLPNNNASVQAFRLHDNHIVIAFDNAQDSMVNGKKISALRKPLTVALSTDEGKTWSLVRDVETGRPGFGQAERKINQPGREEYSYPSIMQTRDGMIHVAYTFRRQTIKVVSFDEEWLRNGNSTGIYHKPE